MKTQTIILFTILLISASAFGAPPILNGKEVPENHILRKSTVSILQEKEGTFSSFCTGTVIGPKVVLTAAHCVDEWSDGNIYIGQGTNPVSGVHFPVSKLRFIHNNELGGENDPGDLAILIISSELAGLHPVKIGNPSALRKENSFIQTGYGANTEEESSEWPHFGKLLMQTSGKFDDLQHRTVTLKEKKGFGVLGGDSGGPLYVSKGTELILHGVLHGGSDVHSNYMHPYFAINWINCGLQDSERIHFDGPLSEQIPCGDAPVVQMSELAAYSKKICEEGRPGWSIRGENSCWPATREACEAYEREIQEGLIWNSVKERCHFSDEDKSMKINLHGGNLTPERVLSLLPVWRSL